LENIDYFAPRFELQADIFAAILKDHLDKSICDEIVDRSEQMGVPPQRVLLQEGWLTADQYVRALAAFHRVGFVALPDHAAPYVNLVDATGPSPARVASEIYTARGLGREPVLFVSALDRSVGANETLATATVDEAIDALRLRQPEASAGRRMWLWQYVVLALGVGVCIGAAVSAPQMFGIGVLLASAAVFACVAIFRLLLLAATVVPVRKSYARARFPLSDGDLPTYSVLVPLFREADMLPDLVEALTALDYPRAKLDIVLILEESDAVTLVAARQTAMPPFMRVIVVPDRQPRTKPKALAMALKLTRGELIAVFDAEDIPAVDQLRKAASVFVTHPGRYACLQARLAIYNARQSPLTRQFAIEYAMLFQVFLPALRLLRWPMPLSGTSNHFMRDKLDALAWDPFNVTEDADLGIRLARARRAGGEIGLIESDTYEEAPAGLRQWLPQRTRWIKGWMQTYLVHTRQPWRLARELGLWRLLGFHALLGGFLISVLAYPLLLTLLVAETFSAQPFATEPGSLHHAALSIALTELIAGFVAALLMAVAGVWRARLAGLVVDIIAAPVYWLLISIAGYRALIQIIWWPHLWEKTEHSARRR
jgi:glycosyltransferase XagB